MDYEEIYKEIVDEFESNIKSNNEELKCKLRDCFIKWYKFNLESQLKKAIREEKQGIVINIFKEIKNICNLNDYDKLRFIYHDEEFVKFEELSQHIFNLIRQHIKSGSVDFSDDKYNYFLNCINEYEKKVSNVFLIEYKKLRSECLLDLEYLKKNGRVECYSFRTYDLLKSKI